MEERDRRGYMPDEPIPVRLSHLLRYCAVGAVVRGPDRLVTVQDTSAWRCGPDHEIRYVDQVRVALGIGKTLRSPPTPTRAEGLRLPGLQPPAAPSQWPTVPRRPVGRHVAGVVS
jgi:hypothetical protein